jgi:hypothetical protein
MNKPTFVVLGMMAALFTAVGAGSAPQAFAQYFGGGSEALTQEQLDYCEQYEINPCTQNNILAKERVLGAQNTQYGNNPEGSGTPYLKGLETWGVIGALAAIFGGVAAAFFFKGRGAKQASA